MLVICTKDSHLPQLFGLSSPVKSVPQRLARRTARPVRQFLLATIAARRWWSQLDGCLELVRALSRWVSHLVVKRGRSCSVQPGRCLDVHY